MTPALGPEQLEGYLERIDYRGDRLPSSRTLAALHTSHMLTVPFENLDIVVTGRHIDLSLDAIYEKIVERRRGGFCYEHNGLFAAALVAMGFDVTMHSARVHMPDGRITPEFDHLTLRVDLNDERWLADVGFGDSFLQPLRLVADLEQSDGRSLYRLDREGEDWVLLKQEQGRWTPLYRFTEKEHPLAAFRPRCDWLQSSPDSTFIQRFVCSRATTKGRITLTAQELVETVGTTKRKIPAPEAERTDLLRRHFGISL